MKKLVLLAVVLIGITATSFAQATATANASATILPKVSVQKNNDLNFGGIYTGATGGTVVIAAQDGNVTRTGTASMNSGTGNAAKFTISGMANAPVTVVLPGTILNLTGAGVPMPYTLATNITPGTGGALAAFLDWQGNYTFWVGGTLTVGATQAPGTYSGSFTMTVTNP
jgi:hypothetical protein